MCSFEIYQRSFLEFEAMLTLVKHIYCVCVKKNFCILTSAFLILPSYFCLLTSAFLLLLFALCLVPFFLPAPSPKASR